MQKGGRQLENSVLFGRVASILEQARRNVVRSVNSEMVVAYWLIGREIVEEIQAGKDRAGYGRAVIQSLSEKLNERFGKGFSKSNLLLFRRFYLAFAGRCVEADCEFRTQCVVNSAGFMPSLGWSHYRVLMRVEHPAARTYYEREADSNGWSVRQLERQMGAYYVLRTAYCLEKGEAA